MRFNWEVLHTARSGIFVGEKDLRTGSMTFHDWESNYIYVYEYIYIYIYIYHWWIGVH